MPNNSFSNNRIAKNTIFLYIRMIIVLIISLYTTRVVLNELGVVDYGIYNVVAGFVSLFSFLNSAMNNATQRFFNYERSVGTSDSLQIIYNTSLQIQFVIAIVSVVLLESFGYWYINNKLIIPADRLMAANWVFQCSVVSLFLLIIQIPYSAAIISHEKMDYFAIVSILDAFLKLAIVLILPFVDYDKMVLYGTLMLGISVLNFLLYLVYAKVKFEEIKMRLVFHKDKFKEMLSFSGWNTFGSFAYTIQNQGLNVLINAFYNPAVNAARAIAFQIQAAINGFSENIAMAFRPQLVESFAIGNHSRTRMLMFRMSKYSYMMLYVLSVPIILELHYILGIWLKGVIPEYTLIFSCLVIANMLINSLNLPISQTVQATGKVKVYQIIRSIIVTSTLPISWVALKLGASPTAVFWVTLSITIINQPVSMMILHRQFPFSYLEYIKAVIFPCVLLSVLIPILPAFVHFIVSEGFVRFALVCFITVISSCVIIFYLFLDDSERLRIRQYIFNIQRKFAKK